MPLLTQSSTNPNISSLQTQGNLFNLMLAVNSRLNLPFNYFNQVTFAPETYGAVLKYDQATPVKVMFKVQGMDQET